MDFFRTAVNPWGQEVLVGVAWDLMWLAVGASAAFVVGHALWLAARRRRGSGGAGGGVTEEAAPEAASAPGEGGGGTGLPERLPRHGLGARLFHWTMAAAMFALLITAFVPVMGWQFSWVAPHWIAGVVLVLAVLYHIIHATFFQDLWAMWRSPAELPQGLEELRHALGAGEGEAPRAGKYSFDHQLYHHMAALATLAAAGTGLLMMVRVDTPFWTRNPYLLSDAWWGVVYVVHGLSGVALIGLVAAHVYFAVRPEKRWITWSMIRGWIDREHYLAHHDPARWDPTGGD